MPVRPALLLVLCCIGAVPFLGRSAQDPPVPAPKIQAVADPTPGSGGRCGARVANDTQRKIITDDFGRFRIANPDLKAVAIPLTIRVNFIHITDGTNGGVTKEAREAQLKVLNDAYKSAGFRFEEADVVVRLEAKWFKMAFGGTAEREVKKEIYKDPKKDPTKYLNIYTAQALGDLLGWAQYPWELAGDRELDGVVLDWRTLPGGSRENFNEGKTATHEVGHWLGLFHTFHDYYLPTNDLVEDTLPHKEMNGKPTYAEANKLLVLPFDPLKEENKSKIDDVRKNYMNYVHDAWMDRFTPLQIDRMKRMTMIYRKELFVAAPNAAANVGKLPFNPITIDP